MVVPRKLKPIPRPLPPFPQKLKKEQEREVLELHLYVEEVLYKSFPHRRIGVDARVCKIHEGFGDEEELGELRACL